MRFMFKSVTFFFVIFLQVFVAFAQKPDTRVAETLKELNFKYIVKSDGTYETKIPLNSRTQLVYIHSNTSTYDKLELREIYSVIYQSAQKPDESKLLRLLLDNSQKKLGAWELIYENKIFFIVFTAKVAATLDASDTKSVIDIVSNASDSMEQQLFMTDEW